MPVVRRITARIKSITKYSDNVCSMVLNPDQTVPKFRPGQFLHLALDPFDPTRQWPESRVFSIANSPTRSSLIRIVFSVKGSFSKRMMDEGTVGRTVWLKLPYGSFTLEDNERHKVFVAGGTGITPFVSFLEYAIDCGAQSPISLYYGVRIPPLMIFGDLIEECAKKIKHFDATISVEQNSSGHAEFKTGSLNMAEILESVVDKQNCDFYLSGPWKMVDSFKATLLQSSVSQSNIFIDDWGR